MKQRHIKKVEKKNIMSSIKECKSYYNFLYLKVFITLTLDIAINGAAINGVVINGVVIN